MNYKQKNKDFLAASPEQKRVMIAEDVLSMLSNEKLIPCIGSFYDDNDVPYSGSIQEWVKSEKGKCEVCAKGALFFSTVGIVNQFNFEDLNRKTIANNFEDDAHKKLLEFFSPEQLDMIETAFEGCSYLGIISGEDYEKSVEFNSKFSYSEVMREIMNNIVQNNGTFIP